MIAEIMTRLDKILAGDREPAEPVIFENELIIRESVSRIGDALRPAK